MIVLAGDIGGTNSRLALYREQQLIFDRTYPSADHPSCEAAVIRFLGDVDAALGTGVRPERACFGIAGPIDNDTARVTNLPWFVEARRLEERTGITRVALVNDFQAAALGVTVVGPEHLVQIGGGARQPQGPVAVAGAGTGLGEAFLVWGPSGYQVLPSEGGHVDFAARTGLEAGLLNHLVGRYSRVSFERVLSGPGLVDIFGYLMSEPACRVMASEETKAAMLAEDPAAVITRQALAGRDPACTLAVNLFCSVLGGLAGNLALTLLSTGGVFIAGGIAPRILPFMTNGLFREGFEAKGRFQPMVARIPAFVVTHREVGLLGAAAFARQL